MSINRRLQQIESLFGGDCNNFGNDLSNNLFVDYEIKLEQFDILALNTYVYFQTVMHGERELLMHLKSMSIRDWREALLLHAPKTPHKIAFDLKAISDRLKKHLACEGLT